MIRLATPHDAGPIAELVRTSFDARLHDFMIYAQHGIDRFISTQIALPTTGPERYFLVDTDEGGGLRAFAEFQYNESGSAFLPYICVAPEARGMGLATALITHFLGFTQSSTTLQLDVFADNAPALALYRNLGFERVADTGWFVRDIPSLTADADAFGLRVTNAVEPLAMYAYYGFCRYGVAWRGGTTTLGRIGPRTLRCFTRNDFCDDALLAAGRNLFGEPRRALYIGPIDDRDRSDDTLLFLTSHRLAQTSRSQLG